MWIVKAKNVAFNLEQYDRLAVEENILIFGSSDDEIEKHFEYETHELAKKSFNHIIDAMKRKERVVHL